MAKRLPLIILLWLGADIYFYQAVKAFIDSDILRWCYWFLDLLLMGGIVSVIFTRRGSSQQQTLIAWLMGLMLLAFIPRLFSVPILLVEDITRLFRGFPPRAFWVSGLTLGIAAVIFIIILFGSVCLLIKGCRQADQPTGTLWLAHQSSSRHHYQRHVDFIHQRECWILLWSIVLYRRSTAYR